MALLLVVELRQCAFDLTVQERDNTTRRCHILKQIGKTHQGVHEDIESPSSINIYQATNWMHLTLLWLDEQIHDLNIEGSLHYHIGSGHRTTDPQPYLRYDRVGYVVSEKKAQRSGR